jgi:FtsZ-interacting cell division protein ZipA
MRNDHTCGVVVLVAIVVDVALVGFGWWAVATWRQRRRATARYERELHDVMSEVLESSPAAPPHPPVFDAVATGDYEDWTAFGAPATVDAPPEPAHDAADRAAVSQAEHPQPEPPPAEAQQPAEPPAEPPAEAQQPAAEPRVEEEQPAEQPAPVAARPSEVLLARLRALRDTPGAGVADEINNSDLQPAPNCPG